MLYEKIDHDPKCPLIQEQKARIVTLGTGYTKEEKTGTYTLDDNTQLKKCGVITRNESVQRISMFMQMDLL